MLSWKKYKYYEEAEQCQNCLFIFKMGNQYHYVGKAENFAFQAPRFDGKLNILFDALIISGFEIHIAELNNQQWLEVDNFMLTLIHSEQGKAILDRMGEVDFIKIPNLIGP